MSTIHQTLVRTVETSAVGHNKRKVPALLQETITKCPGIQEVSTLIADVQLKSILPYTFQIYDKLIYSPLFSSPQFEPLTESVENGNLLHKQFMKKCSRILLAGGELNLTNIKVFF